MTSYQERFRNLLLHMGKIYSAQNDARTALLMRGLDDVVAKINPTEVSQWKDVLSDSKRILKVWQACENAAAAPIMAAEILSSIEEFSSSETAADVPALVISDAPAPAPAPETIHHVSPAQKAVFQSPLMRAAPPPVQVAQTVTVVHKEGHVEEEEEVEETEEEEEVEEEEAEEEEETEEIVEEQEAEEEEETGEVVEPEAEEEEETEEVVEPEADEEEAMEVEPYMYRGRKYWLDTNTKKLYVVEGEDDVGDEVGILVSGKPVFCAA